MYIGTFFENFRVFEHIVTKVHINAAFFYNAQMHEILGIYDVQSNTQSC